MGKILFKGTMAEFRKQFWGDNPSELEQLHLKRKYAILAGDMELSQSISKEIDELCTVKKPKRQRLTKKYNKDDYP